MLIAIDGPAGAGKSTIARALAERLGFTYLDSGAMYRCVALAVLRRDADPTDERAAAATAREIDIELGPDSVRLGGDDVSAEIREPRVSETASRVAIHPQVRSALVEQQRRITEDGGWVAEGRDIGTVVRPDAPLKVFLTASEQERARRRAADTGQTPEQVLAEQRDRDARDQSREHGALKAAEDAVEVDTTGREIDEVLDRIEALAAERGLL